MSYCVFAAGLVSATVLLTLLIRTLLDSDFRAWPSPGPGTWQHLIFWSAFRILNLSAIVLACIEPSGALGLHEHVRLAGLIVLAGSLSLYLHALSMLGRANTYCKREGLVTSGIYRWTRNPQYATIIPMYAGLALAADGAGTYLLCGALGAVYVLMALVEEPWLRKAYGATYVRYCRRVPRFFNWRRGVAWCSVSIRQLDRQLHLRWIERSTGSTSSTKANRVQN